MAKLTDRQRKRIVAEYIERDGDILHKKNQALPLTERKNRGTMKALFF